MYIMDEKDKFCWWAAPRFEPTLRGCILYGRTFVYAQVTSRNGRANLRVSCGEAKT